MFTGIVTAVGEIVAIEERPALRRLAIATDSTTTPPAIGASISCSGVCLTVVEVREQQRLTFVVELGPETLRVTTAAYWRRGTKLNLERALRIGDELGGHLVTGHVDGIAEIVGRKQHPETIAFRFAAPPPLARFIAAKGSVCLDGTSLTVNGVEGATFDCHLIPHTLAVTTWNERHIGDRVNLEVDLIARYAERLIGKA